jgi:hypothetical protein
MLIDMKVAGLAVDPMTEMPILILKDMQDENPLPIWVGLVEAGAIASELEHIDLKRPMTHDLIKGILDQLGVQVMHVEITDLRENTYYATIVLNQGTKVLEVDARPSDAIALALRARCPIRVEEKVLEKAREIDLRPPRNHAEEHDPEAAADLLSGLGDEDFGKWKM